MSPKLTYLKPEILMLLEEVNLLESVWQTSDIYQPVM
jgi:hypothetical protein